MCAALSLPIDPSQYLRRPKYVNENLAVFWVIPGTGAPELSCSASSATAVHQVPEGEHEGGIGGEDGKAVLAG
jgi:hypothetical protein